MVLLGHVPAGVAPVCANLLAFWFAFSRWSVHLHWPRPSALSCCGPRTWVAVWQAPSTKIPSPEVKCSGKTGLPLDTHILRVSPEASPDSIQLLRLHPAMYFCFLNRRCPKGPHTETSAYRHVWLAWTTCRTAASWSTSSVGKPPFVLYASYIRATSSSVRGTISASKVGSKMADNLIRRGHACPPGPPPAARRRGPGAAGATAPIVRRLPNSKVEDPSQRLHLRHLNRS